MYNFAFCDGSYLLPTRLGFVIPNLHVSEWVYPWKDCLTGKVPPQKWAAPSGGRSNVKQGQGEAWCFHLSDLAPCWWVNYCVPIAVALVWGQLLWPFNMDQRPVLSRKPDCQHEIGAAETASLLHWAASTFSAFAAWRRSLLGFPPRTISQSSLLCSAFLFCPFVSLENADCYTHTSLLFQIWFSTEGILN